MKKSVTIQLEEEVFKILKKRSKKKFLTVKELIEDTIRRSTISYKKRRRPVKVDDRLVAIFSKQNKGPRKYKKKKS